MDQKERQEKKSVCMGACSKMRGREQNRCVEGNLSRDGGGDRKAAGVMEGMNCGDRTAGCTEQDCHLRTKITSAEMDVNTTS